MESVVQWKGDVRQKDRHDIHLSYIQTVYRTHFHYGCVSDIFSHRLLPLQGREVWFQVKIPISRNLTVGCGHRGDGDPEARDSFQGHPCPPQVPFYYLPIDHQDPRRPCG